MDKKTIQVRVQKFIPASIIVGAFIAGIFLTPDFALSSSDSKSAVTKNSKPSPASINLTAQTNTSKNATPAGSLEGNLQVTATGAASYSIPIALPPGTAGIVPQLSIAYSSQQDNGLLGMGFSLQGLTAITRCPSNKAQNNVIHGVDYTDQDRFCLNGQQLVAVKGAYGQDGTEYRTYVDSASRIISYGRQGNGPASFKVWVKGSQIAEYGFTDDSRVYAEGKPTLASWAINKIKDNAGNYFTVHYFQDNNVAYADRIEYTGNENAKTTPPDAVTFTYEDRPDARDMYRAGSRLKMAKRLNSIQAYAENQLVYTYKFTYEQGPNTGRTRLTQMQKCDANDLCLPPTKFEWQTNEEGWEAAPQYNLQTSEIARDGMDMRVNFVDLNGDGLVDVVQKAAAVGLYDSAWINTGNGWKQDTNYPLKTWYALHDNRDMGVRFLDLNGDGLVDVLQNVWTAGMVQYNSAWFNTGTGWKDAGYLLPDVIMSRSKGCGHWEEDTGVRFIDLNADGLPDIIDKTWTSDMHNYNNAWFNTGSSWVEAPKEYLLPVGEITSRTGDCGVEDMGVRFLDLNGDGITDVVQKTWSDIYHQGNLAGINAGGNGWRLAPEYILPPSVDNITRNSQDRGVRFDDLNKDGLTDLIWSSDTGHEVWLNNGTGWSKNDVYGNVPKWFIYADGKDAGSRLVDVNGDGFPDLVYSVDRTEPEYHGVWLNMPNGWYAKPNQGYWNMPKGIVTSDGKDNGVRFVDLEGTGLPALVFKNDHDQGVWLNKAKKLPDYLIAITDGLNERVSLTYKPLTDKTIYTKGTGTKYPDMDIQNAMYVVTQTASGNTSNDPKTQNNNNGQHITNYTYAGARQNHLGWGFLGFRQVTAQDVTTGIKTTTTYSQDYNKHNLFSPILTETRLSNGTLIASIQNNWDFVQKTDDRGQKTEKNNSYYLPYISSSVTKAFRLDGSLVSTKTTETQIDDFNNPTLIVNQIQDNTGTYTTTTKNTYNNRINDNLWSIGELTHAEVTTEAPNKPAITRTSDFSYNQTTGILMQTVAAPDDEALSATTTYERDVFGNITKTTVSGKDIETRESTAKYDAYGRFVVEETNALGHVTTQTVDPKFGKPSSITDPNGTISLSQYDGFGRLKYQKPNDKINVNSTIEYLKCADTWCPGGAAYVEIKKTTDSPTTVIYYDPLNRKIATTSQGFDGRTIVERTEYDDLGRPVRTSLPGFEYETEYFSNMEYDELGQMKKLTKADGSVIQMIYDGLATTTINPLNQRTTKIANARGNIIEVIDNLGKHTYYDYDAYGNLLKVTDPKNNISTIEYDKLGRKKAIHDPDKGDWSYAYDVLGELKTQTDSLGQKTTFQYDKLGRMILRTDPSGTSSWEYDTAPHGIGKLAKVTGVAGNKGQRATGNEIIKAFRDGIMDYTRTYVYDELSRPTETDVKINDQTYSQKTSYDKDSRPDEITYVNGLKVKNIYNNLSYLTQIINSDTHAAYQTINSMDAQGHVTSTTHSNGLITLNTYDPRNGFLTDINTGLSTSLEIQKKMFPAFTAVDQVLEKINSQKEKTINEANKKLKTSTEFPVAAGSVAAGFSLREISAVPSTRAKARGYESAVDGDGANGQIQNSHYIYDQLGNIKERDDNIVKRVETFGYDDLNRLTQNTDSISGTTTYRYDEIGNLKYKSDVGTYTYGEDGAGPHAVTRIEGNLPSKFAYDKNGDQVLGALGAETRKIIYTSYSKPLFITTDKAEVQFLYNADRDRFVRIDKVKNKTTTTLYLGSSELVSTNDGTSVTTEYKNYIGSTLYIEKHSPSQAKNTSQGSNSGSPVVAGSIAAGFSLREISAVPSTRAKARGYESAATNSRDDGNFAPDHAKNNPNKINGIENSQSKTSSEHPVAADFSLRPKISYDANGNEVTTNLYTLLTDNLGSVVAITDEQANITQRFYYTPFGEQKQIDGKTLDAPLTHKGFTGHEEVECVNLIHMSGRMYDPRIGRFLSADPFVQDYENPQTLNRYSYCLNNPITFTDPSGYWSLSDFFDSICDIFKNLFSANGLLSLVGMAALAILGSPLLAAAVMAISSGVATAASGGSMESVLFAMGSSFATSLIWMGTGTVLEGMKCGVGVAADKWLERALVHGLVGGGIQAAEGGSFKDGFLGAAVAEAMSCRFSSIDANGKANFNIVERVSASYIIGGTAAAAAGGNFQNGAITAAYAELFNDLTHEMQEKLHDSFSKLARDRIPYEEMDCNHSIAKGFEGTDLKYKQEGVSTFPSDVNAKHFSALSVDQLKSGHQTGDIAVWKGINPKTGEYEHHMAVYDANTGADRYGRANNIWTAYRPGGNDFGPGRYQSFSKNFGFDPIWHRYSP